MSFHYVKDMMDVIELALMPNKVKNAVHIVYKEENKPAAVG